MAIFIAATLSGLVPENISAIKQTLKNLKVSKTNIGARARSNALLREKKRTESGVDASFSTGSDYRPWYRFPQSSLEVRRRAKIRKGQFNKDKKTNKNTTK